MFRSAAPRYLALVIGVVGFYKTVVQKQLVVAAAAVRNANLVPGGMAGAHPAREAVGEVLVGHVRRD